MARSAVSPDSELAVARAQLMHALESCATEADIVQVLYAGLHPVFSYSVIVLMVLEREGWYHSLAIDSGVLQDVRRRTLRESVFGPLFSTGETAVVHPEGGATNRGPSRGAGVNQTPRTVVWVPIRHRDQLIAAVSYQSLDERDASPEERAFLEQIHRQLGVLVANAYLNDTTRDQALRLSALNAIARALSSTLDEGGVVSALYSTLSQLLPVEILELVAVDEQEADEVRVLRHTTAGLTSTTVSGKAKQLSSTREVLDTGAPRLQRDRANAEFRSGVSVPIKEGGLVRGVLSIFATDPDAYEDSTVVFLEQVGDEVALAVRNAWSYAAIEAQRRRLEVVNAVGRRLASSLDRWSIMRTLREELSRHLDFDGFILATIRESRDGPVAEGYQYASGLEQPAYAVPLARTGASREAYESREPVLVRRSPWAQSLEARNPTPESLVFSEGAAIFVGPENRRQSGRVATRSFVWVPVLHGDRVSALLSLQSYREEAFGDWHVNLLQDVAAHVSLALANAEYYAAAQAERRRLEALHVLELGVAGSADERQISEAVFAGVRSYMEASNLLVCYVDPQARLTGYGSEHSKPVEVLEPKPLDQTLFFRKLVETGTTLVERVPDELRTWRPGIGWMTDDARMPAHVVWIPIFQGDRVVAALSAQRLEDQPFTEDDVRLLESSAPVVGIALRTVRLHRANELALANTVRIQEVAALAGHDLVSVVTSVADQARTMLEAGGVACWAFDDEGRVTASAANGDEHAAEVLSWSGRTPERNWDPAPHGVLTGDHSSVIWSLIPLWYGDRLVGALGSVHAMTAPEDPGTAPLDFARHAAIAIENARLVAETRGRIHTLEAVAAFTELDITQPGGTRTEMARLIERALIGSNGALWLLEGTEMIRVTIDSEVAERLEVSDPVWFANSLRTPGGNSDRRLRSLLAGVSRTKQDVYAYPILVDGQPTGMLTVEGAGASATETRRLMSVLAGQAAVVLNRLRLVDALDRERQMMDAILRHSPVGVILEDAEGRVVYANPQVEVIYGVPAEAMTGRQADEIVTEAGAVVASDPEADTSAGYELQMRNPDRFVHVRRVHIPGSEGEPGRILTLHEDITQERQVLEAKDLMLRAIGHEVRSPAAAMKTTLAGILQWDAMMAADQRRDLLSEAYEQSDRLLSLVENQLIIAKLETKRFEPNPVPVPLPQTLEQIMQVLQNRYGERISAVDVRLRENLPAAYCEPTHLAQVLTNLIGNALEYTRAPIHVSANVRGGWLEVTVSDEGQGLPPERVETLFQKTGPAGQNRARGGLGLGLYLCRLVVERSFGGKLWLDKTGKAGTTFKFTVQAAEPVEERQAAGVGL